MTVRYFLDDYDPLVDSMMSGKGWTKVPIAARADVFVFVGGDDVNPVLYGEKQHPRTHWTPNRHASSMLAWSLKCEFNKPAIGICRGAQFLCVMSGGRLWQDVTRHAISGTHIAYDLDTGEKFPVTSTHHQMMRTPKSQWESEVLAVASEGSIRESMSGEDYDRQEAEIEAVWHPHTESLSYQPHPEYESSNHPCQIMFWRYVNIYLGL